MLIFQLRLINNIEILYNHHQHFIAGKSKSQFRNDSKLKERMSFTLLGRSDRYMRHTERYNGYIDVLRVEKSQLQDRTHRR